MSIAKKRFLELDFLRGLAVLGMIVFHFFFILDFYQIYSSEMFSGWWHVLGQFVRFTFLILVGIGMVISFERSHSLWRQVKRGIIVLFFAMIVTLATWFFVPDQYVRFGILHLIGTSIIILSLIVKWHFIALLLAIFAMSLGYYVRDGIFILFQNSSIQTIDYFPIFPWIGVVAFGIFLGHNFYTKEIARPNFGFLQKVPLMFLGRHSLLIYMLHVPIILALLFGSGVLKSF